MTYVFSLLAQGTTGNDAFDFRSTLGQVTGTNKGVKLSALAGNDVALGSNYDDELSGGGGHDQLFGGNGNDSLFGGVGDDYLVGERGNDSLLGGAGNDTLVGDGGNDTLNGGNGNDILTARIVAADYREGVIETDHLLGGDGQDMFIFQNNLAGSQLSVIVRDFTVGQDDFNFDSIGVIYAVETTAQGSDTLLSLVADYESYTVLFKNISESILDSLLFQKAIVPNFYWGDGGGGEGGTDSGGGDYIGGDGGSGGDGNYGDGGGLIEPGWGESGYSGG